MEWFLIYLFVMVEKIGSLLMFGWGMFWGGFVCIGIAVIISGINADCGSKTFADYWNGSFAKVMKRFAVYMVPLGFVFGTMGYLLPSQKDLAIIIGSGVTYNVLTSETGQRIGGKAVQLLEEKIDAALVSNATPKQEEVK